MRFGSVEFFKVLIKTVLAIAFFVPLVLCIVFAILLWHKGNELDEAKKENERITLAAQVLTEQRAGTVEDFYELYKESGLSSDELIKYLNEQGGDTPAQTPPTDSTLASKPEPKPSESSAPPVTTPAAQTDEQSPDTAEAPSAYAGIHEDMYVSSPAEMVREEGTVYLTFDDGPSDNTYHVLNYLKQYGAKATFFVVPSRTPECYAALQAIAADGHSIGVHSASHDYEKIYASVEAYLEDFYEAWSIIYDATGIKTEIFRFPGGSKNDFNEATRDAIIAEMSRRGFRYFDWNVDSNDANDADWTEMYYSVLNDISQNYRSVVLMHDSEPRLNTVLVLEDILSVLAGEGYKMDKINSDTQPVQFIGPYA